MNISGVLIRTYPHQIETVSAGLAELDGVEVHGFNPDGRMVVTVERDSDGGMAETFANMHDVPGVLSASMIYHRFEDEEFDNHKSHAQPAVAQEIQ